MHIESGMISVKNIQELSCTCVLSLSLCTLQLHCYKDFVKHRADWRACCSKIFVGSTGLRIQTLSSSEYCLKILSSPSFFLSSSCSYWDLLFMDSFFWNGPSFLESPSWFWMAHFKWNFSFFGEKWTQFRVGRINGFILWLPCVFITIWIVTFVSPLTVGVLRRTSQVIPSLCEQDRGCLQKPSDPAYYTCGL